MSVASYQEERRRLQSSLARDEQELAVAVQDLREAARRMLTPRNAIAQRVGALMAGAFVVGLWLGHRSRR